MTTRLPYGEDSWMSEKDSWMGETWLTNRRKYDFGRSLGCSLRESSIK